MFRIISTIRFCKFVLFLLLGLLFPQEARMSLLYEKHISLNDLIKRSSVIVLATPINKKDGKEDSERFYGFTVSDVIFEKNPSLSQGSKIFVFPGNYVLWKAMSNHYKEHRHEGMPSLKVDSYKSSLGHEGFKSASKCLLFMNPLKDSPGRFEFAVEGSFEAFGKKKEVTEILNAVGTPIDFEKETVIEIDARVDSPPYNNTDRIVIALDKKHKKALLEYSGLNVQGQEAKNYQVRKPGKGKISLSNFETLVSFIKKTGGWHAQKPEWDRPSAGSAWYTLTIKTEPKGTEGVGKSTVVESWYFSKDGYVTDEFRDVFIKIGNVYKKDFGKAFYYVAKYD